MNYDEDVEDVDSNPDGEIEIPLDGDDDDGADYQEDDED